MATDDNRMTDSVDAQLNPEDLARKFVAALDDDSRDWLNAQSPHHRRRIIEVAVRAGFDVAAGGSLDVDDLTRLLTEQAPPLRGPAESAPKAEWADYCTALGADRGRIEGRTAHYGVVPHESGVGLTNGYATPPALTKDELVELADRLGG